MKEFKVNEYITLKLEEQDTYIYINGRKSKHYVGLFLNVYDSYRPEHEQIEFIDQAVESLKYLTYHSITERNDPLTSKRGRDKYNITPEQEFWGHCSNIQVWVENNYDMSLLHSTLAFKLLKSLSNAGEPYARKQYKKEIVKRFQAGHIESCYYLLSENYQRRFNKEERKQFFLKNNPLLYENIKNFLDQIKLKKPEIPMIKRPAIELLRELSFLRDNYAKQMFDNYLQEVKDREPTPLTVERFWDIIQRSYDKANGSVYEQEHLLIEDLKNRTIDEICCFAEYFRYFKGLLYENLLYNALKGRVMLWTSDDGWDYQRGHFVMLGKRAFELACYEPHKFVDELQIGKYGDPDNMGHEFWAVSTVAFELKTGLTYTFFDDLSSKDLNKELRAIFNKLESAHNERVNQKNSTEGRLYGIYSIFDNIKAIYISNGFETLIEYLTEKINSEGIEYLLYFVHYGGLELFNDNELLHFIKNSDIDFFKTLIAALVKYDAYKDLYYDRLFPEEFINVTRTTIKDKILEILLTSTHTERVIINRLILTNYLDKEDINNLFENTEFLKHYISTLRSKPCLKKLLEVYVDSRNYISFLLDHIKNLSLYTIYQIYHEIYYDYDKVVMDIIQNSLEIKFFEKIKPYIITYTHDIQEKKVLELFSLFDRSNSDDIRYLSKFNRDILVPLLIKIFIDDSEIKPFFLAEFKKHFRSYNKNGPEFDLFQSFLEYSNKEQLKPLIDNKDSNFFRTIFNLIRKNSMAYTMKDWEHRSGVNNDWEFWSYGIFKHIGDLICEPLNEEIIKIFKSGNIDDIIFILDERLYERINPEDLNFLVSNPEINFFEKVFEALKKRENLDFMIEGGDPLFSDGFKKKFKPQLRKAIAEVLKKKDATDLEMLESFGLLDYLNNDKIT